MESFPLMEGVSYITPKINRTGVQIDSLASKFVANCPILMVVFVLRPNVFEFLCEVYDAVVQTTINRYSLYCPICGRDVWMRICEMKTHVCTLYTCTLMRFEILLISVNDISVCLMRRCLPYGPMCPSKG